MTTAEILATLKKSGIPQTAAIYKHYGTGDNVLGTLTSEIGRLQKKIKVDHALALDLWKTGNAEARMLALQIADPQRVTTALADTLLAASARRRSAALRPVSDKETLCRRNSHFIRLIVDGRHDQHRGDCLHRNLIPRLPDLRVRRLSRLHLVAGAGAVSAPRRLFPTLQTLSGGLPHTAQVSV